MFGSRSARALPAAPAAVVEKPQDLDEVIDAFAQTVRAFGELAFDTDRVSAGDTREACQELVRRIAFGPTRDDAPREEAPPPRDFQEARRFVEQRRREERDFVVRSSTNLRQALQAFARCLNAAIAEDQSDDQKIEFEIARLVQAASSQDPAQMSARLGAVVSLVQAVFQRRREREKRHREDLGRRVVELKTELEVVRNQAVIDALTQLYNRAAFMDEIERAAALGVFLAGDPCLLLVDVDHFKSINDRHGHPAGDAVLVAVADNMARHFMRREDFVARYGGEEFAILTRESSLERTIERAGRMREAQRKLTLPVAGAELVVTISIGIARIAPGEPAAKWIERADKALYQAKQNGRDRVEVAG